MKKMFRMWKWLNFDLLMCMAVWILVFNQIQEQANMTVPLDISHNISTALAQNVSYYDHAIVLHRKPALNLQEEEEIDYMRAKYYKYLLETSALCNVTQHHGKPKLAQGGYRLCTAGPYAPTVDNCTILSFGIGNDWSFEDSVADTYHCNISAFDPTIKPQGKKRGEYISIYYTGIGQYNLNTFSKNYEIKTFGSILKFLGKQNMTIDYVKLDVEQSEWGAVLTMIEEGSLSHVKQLAVETHSWLDYKQQYLKHWDILLKLEKYGFFKWFAWNMNDYLCYKYPHSDFEYCPISQLIYINSKFLK